MKVNIIEIFGPNRQYDTIEEFAEELSTDAIMIKYKKRIY